MLFLMMALALGAQLRVGSWKSVNPRERWRGAASPEGRQQARPNLSWRNTMPSVPADPLTRKERVSVLRDSMRESAMRPSGSSIITGQQLDQLNLKKADKGKDTSDAPRGSQTPMLAKLQATPRSRFLPAPRSAMKGARAKAEARAGVCKAVKKRSGSRRRSPTASCRTRFNIEDSDMSQPVGFRGNYVPFKYGGKYVGQLKNGKKHGKGKYTYPSGATRYVGQLKNGKKHGKGKYTYPSGATYDGEWKDDMRDGKGKYTYPDESTYVGQWKDDKMHGEGTYTAKYGGEIIEMYVGQLKNGKKHGNGKYYYPTGATYVGQWKNDKKHGKGKYTYPDKSTYDGEWEYDKKHGKCIQTYPSGATRYDGEVKNGKKHGNGKYYYPSDATYVGQWKNDKKHGNGKYTYPDESTYVGQWKNGKKHGNGTYIDKNKIKYVGRWEDDEWKGYEVDEEDFIVFS